MGDHMKRVLIAALLLATVVESDGKEEWEIASLKRDQGG